MVTVPEASHPRWVALLKGTHYCELRFLAAKIVVSRYTFLSRSAPNVLSAVQAAAELRELYARNTSLPSAQSDLVRIFA